MSSKYSIPEKDLKDDILASAYKIWPPGCVSSSQESTFEKCKLAIIIDKQ